MRDTSDGVMTESERLIWAAVFAAERAKMRESQRTLGTLENYPGCIEEAWDAVASFRVQRPALVAGWGENDEVVRMYDEMMGPSR